MSRPSTLANRTCGGCTFCCKVMEIEELAKPGGQWCRHADRSTGCAIYGSHPPTCQSFACQWLVSPSLAEELRPDRCKIVLVGELEKGRLTAHCDPAAPVAWRREPVFSLLKEQARTRWDTPLWVIAKAGRRVWFISPIAEYDLGEVDPRSPLQVEKLPDGSMRIEVLPPVPLDQDLGQQLERLNLSGAAGD